MPVGTFEKGTLILVRRDDPNYEASREAGSRIRWLVASKYEVKDWLLRAKEGATWRDYYPFDRKYQDLPSKLAQIKEDDEAALIRFANRYGHLGYVGVSGLWPPSCYADEDEGEVRQRLRDSRHPITGKPPTASEIEKSIERWRLNRGAVETVLSRPSVASVFDRDSLIAWGRAGGGDPLGWICAHIRTVKVCLELSTALQPLEGRRTIDAAARESLRELLHRIYPVGTPVRRSDVVLAKRDEIFSYLGRAEEPSDIEEAARQLRRELINANISEIRCALEPEGRYERSFFEFHALIEVLYWHLKTAVEGGVFKSCAAENCGRYFIQTDRRQQFCPPSADGESPCAALERQRRWRAEQKRSKQSRKRRRGPRQKPKKRGG